MRRIALGVLATAGGFALAGCGTRTVVSTVTVTHTTTSVVTTTVTRTVSPFVPTSFTAISDNAFWLLGTKPCDSGTCAAVMRTTDGGATFAPLPAPPLPTSGGVVPTLRFADHNDGWAFTTWRGGAFYSTHDGGKTWAPLRLGTLLGFATGGGYAYAVTADCGAATCTAYRLQRAPVTGDAWTSVSLPFAPSGGGVDVAAHGRDVWVLGSSGSGPHDLLAHSTDAGTTFSTGVGPCYSDLGGDLEPSSAQVLWAICPTGMMAGAWRSTDAGRTWTSLHTRELVNSTQLAPASDTSAVLVANGAGATPLRTTDAGATWQPVRTPPRSTYWSWAGFTDPHVGAAIVQVGARQELWRTVDGGASWDAVAFSI